MTWLAELQMGVRARYRRSTVGGSRVMELLWDHAHELVEMSERVKELEHELRVCGMTVAKFAGLHGKIKEFKGSTDIYAPDHVVELINNVLVLVNEEINKS